MVTPTPQDTLDELFPVPATLTRSIDSNPVYVPGISSESAEALVRLLKENHERFHIFFNDSGFHNHSTHHLYAIYTLGAPPKVLDAAFETHAVYLRKAIEPPGDITEANWMEHFGDERYFRAYVAFFTKILKKIGINALFGEYVFSDGANWIDGIGDGKKQPQMVNRLLSGVLHPFIHVGYGIQFNSPGMIVEGLALACVQMGPDFDRLLPKSFLIGDSLASRLTSALTLSEKPVDTHSFTIVAQMLKDTQLGPGAACEVPRTRTASKNDDRAAVEGRVFPLTEVLDKRGEIIQKYAERWTVNVNDEEELQAKLDELAFLATLLYGVAGLQEEKEFRADFLSMHLVTSSLFLTAYVKHLSPDAQTMLLRSYLAVALSVWVARGRPAPNIRNFYERTSPTLDAPGPAYTPGKGTLTPGALTPNAWFPLLQSTILHPDEHVPKAQRTLAQYACVYGDQPAGILKGTELKDAELLDGTVFVRVSALTMDRLGWLREGQERRGWDFSGFWN